MGNKKINWIKNFTIPSAAVHSLVMTISVSKELFMHFFFYCGGCFFIIVLYNVFYFFLIFIFFNHKI